MEWERKGMDRIETSQVDAEVKEGARATLVRRGTKRGARAGEERWEIGAGWSAGNIKRAAAVPLLHRRKRIE